MSTKPEQPSGALSAGLAASTRGDTGEALEFFRLAACEDPGSGLPHFLLGAELAQMGEMEKAREAYAKSLLLAPGFAMARYQLGLVLLTGGQASQAMATWGPLLEGEGGGDLQHFVRGFSQLVAGNHLLAIDEFEQGMAMSENAALIQDISRVIERTRAVSDTSDFADEPAIDQHVFLSNYRQQSH